MASGLGKNSRHSFAPAVQWLRSRPWSLVLTSAALTALEKVASLAVSAIANRAVAQFLRDTILLAYGPLWVWCFARVVGEGPPPAPERLSKAAPLAPGRSLLFKVKKAGRIPSEQPASPSAKPEHSMPREVND